MNDTNAFQGLNFSVRRRRIPARALAVAVAFVVFTIMWWVVPEAVFYWVFLPILVVLVWMASYGWRPAVANLVKFLQSLEKI